MVALKRPYQREEWVGHIQYGGTSLPLPLKAFAYDISRRYLGGWAITFLFEMFMIWMILILADQVTHLIILILVKDSGSSI